MKQIKGIKPYRKIAIGYAIIALLTGCIVCVYLNGWQKMEMLKVDSERLHLLRREIHDAYVRMTELSLLGETVMDWSQTAQSLIVPNVWGLTAYCANSRPFIRVNALTAYDVCLPIRRNNSIIYMKY